MKNFECMRPPPTLELQMVVSAVSMCATRMRGFARFLMSVSRRGLAPVGSMHEPGTSPGASMPLSGAPSQLEHSSQSLLRLPTSCVAAAAAGGGGAASTVGSSVGCHGEPSLCSRCATSGAQQIMMSSGASSGGAPSATLAVWRTVQANIGLTLCATTRAVLRL